MRPGIVLAPSLVENQHPDHSRLGRLVRDAARLARYGGVQELRAWPPHRIEQLLFYALTPESEPDDITPVLIDISAPEIVAAWIAAMEAHASQTSARNYVELQLTRARLRGLGAGVEYAIALFSERPARLHARSLDWAAARGDSDMVVRRTALSGSASPAIRRSAGAAFWRRRWARTWPAGDTRCISSVTSGRFGCRRTRHGFISIRS